MKTPLLCCCAWVCVAVVSTADAQTRTFMDAAGNAGAGQPVTGNTLISMDPGTSQAIEVWIVDADPGGTPLSSYQLIFQCTSQDGTAGTVDYVDNNPGMGGGDSLVIDTTRSDWVYDDSIAVTPPVYNETCGSNIFGVIYNTAIPLDDQNIYARFLGDPAYLAEFVIEASADACGTHTYVWNLFENGGAPPLAAMFGVGGSEWSGGDQVPEYQNLEIFIGPTNNACDDAIQLGSTNVTQPFDTSCAIIDGPQDCAPGADIWYTYDSPNACGDGIHFTATAGDLVVYQDASCVQADDGLCNPGPIPNDGGETWLIQVIGDDVAGNVHVTCIGCLEKGCDDFNPCTDIECDPMTNNCLPPIFNNDPCNDGDVCTLDDMCSMGACAPGPVVDCNDFNPCTDDGCVSFVGCDNVDINGAPCVTDADCNIGTVSGATCEAGSCACVAGMTDALCLELRDPKDDGSHPRCAIDGADDQCPDDDYCVDGVCLEQACYAPAEDIVVDLELFPTMTPVCGGQFFLEYDADCLTLTDVDTDPDGELGWSFEFVNHVAGGTIDLALAIPPALQCCVDAGNPLCGGRLDGGTIARLTFTSDGSADDACKCGGVNFRVHNPPSGASGPNGAVDLGGCNDDTDPSGTDSMRIQPETTISGGLGGDIESGSDCGTFTKHVAYPPLTVSDPCAEAGAEADCTVTYQQACDSPLDCGMGDLCNSGADCGEFQCVEDAAAGELGFTGFCATDNCSGGLCQNATAPVGVDLNDYLDCTAGCDFLPGQTCVSCAYTNSCGNTVVTEFCVFNSGLNKLLVDVELSPTMVDGTPGDPIVRCIDFTISTCDASTFSTCSGSSPTPGDLCFPQDQNACGGFPEMCIEQSAGGFDVSSNVVFGSPENIPGHGTACLKVPPGNWDCIEATDPKHSLTSSCSLECDESGVLRATFKGSKATNESCHWLVQGNLDGNPNIDIFDYTILAGEYLNNYGSNDTLCKTGPVEGNNFNADFNGDKIVTLADWSFVVFNFFCASKDPCSALCDPAPQFAGAGKTKVEGPRAAVKVRELYAMGLGEYADAADVNNDGVVDLTDISLFLDSEDAPEDLRQQVKKTQRSHRERELLPRGKRTR